MFMNPNLIHGYCSYFTTSLLSYIDFYFRNKNQFITGHIALTGKCIFRLFNAYIQCFKQKIAIFELLLTPFDTGKIIYHNNTLMSCKQIKTVS